MTDAYWEGVTWDKGTDCGEAFEALKISVRDLNGGPRPPATHDAAQVTPHDAHAQHETFVKAQWYGTLIVV